MSNEHDALMEMLHEVFGEPEKKDKTILRVLKAFESLPTPRIMREADRFTKIHADFTGLAIGASLVYHIEDHGGQDCVKEHLAIYLRDIQTDVLHVVDGACKTLEIANPFDAPDVNADLVKEVLAEIEADKK